MIKKSMVFSGSLWFLNFILIALNCTIVLTFIFLPNHKEQSLLITKKEFTFSPKQREDITQKGRDIFHTRADDATEKTKQDIFVPSDLVSFITPPQLPQNIPFEKKTKKTIPLIPPLQVTLHGTILQKTPLDYKALIAHNMTKTEKIYRIGDIVEDSQIIFIAKDSVTLIRANGQEEKIYLSNKEKIKDLSDEKISLANIIEKNGNEITLKKSLFIKKIPSIEAFINQLGLVIEFKDGAPIGCMIQNGDHEALPQYLGFKQNDIILSIDSYPVNSIEQRIDALASIENKANQASFFSLKVVFLREGNEQEILFNIVP
jgi:hypothetical protein